jgi:hypothetical protein
VNVRAFAILRITVCRTFSGHIVAHVKHLPAPLSRSLHQSFVCVISEYPISFSVAPERYSTMGFFRTILRFVTSLMGMSNPEDIKAKSKPAPATPPDSVKRS